MTNEEKIDIAMMSTASLIADKYDVKLTIDETTKTLNFDCDDKLSFIIAEELARVFG